MNLRDLSELAFGNMTKRDRRQGIRVAEVQGIAGNALRGNTDGDVRWCDSKAEGGVMPVEGSNWRNHTESRDSWVIFNVFRFDAERISHRSRHSLNRVRQGASYPPVDVSRDGNGRDQR